VEKRRSGREKKTVGGGDGLESFKSTVRGLNKKKKFNGGAVRGGEPGGVFAEEKDEVCVRGGGKLGKDAAFKMWVIYKIVKKRHIPH